MSGFTPINRGFQPAQLHPAWVAQVEAESQHPSGQGSAAGHESEVEVEDGLYDGPANSDVDSEYEDDEAPAAHAQGYHESSGQRQEEWAKTTSEIASLGSEELHETRPNRFKGYPSTWRKWTKNDREAWRSLEKVRMNDLGVHLYNDFALRRDAKVKIAEEKAKAPKGKGKGKAKAKAKSKAKGKGKATDTDMDTPMSGQGETGEDDDVDEDEAGSGSVWAPLKTWTAWPGYERGYERLGNGELMMGLSGVERVGEKLPGDNLREEIVAAIMKAAKERYHRRREMRQRREERDVEDDGDAMETDQPETRPAKRRRSPSYEPALWDDDEVLYKMARPATAQIMEKLDGTLTLLHHTRVATMRLTSRPQQGGSENTADGQDTEANQTPKRGRSRTKSGGETPTTPADGEQQNEAGNKEMPPCSRSRAGSVGTASNPTMLTKHHIKLLAKLAPRDWRDVISAAGMAGFEPDVIARAAQRCSTLFQQDITLSTLDEVPLTGSAKPGRTGVKTVRYTPGDLAAGREESDLSSEEDDEEDEGDQGEEEERQEDEELDPEDEQEEDGEDEEEEDAENGKYDKMYGGVHVDGFLQPLSFSDDDWESESFDLGEALEDEEPDQDEDEDDVEADE